MSEENVETAPKEEVESERERFEMDEPVWSVIGFDRCFASGLRYDEAVAELKRRDAEKQTGLCIVSDDAAARLRPHSVL